MFFEGIEKKAEIFLVDSVNLLIDFDAIFWQKLVNDCGAYIISTLHTHQCRAYLLSESSLLVWPHKILIITCGTTRLIDAVEYFLTHISQQQVMGLLYQRKNEHVATVQSSHFFDDVARLDRHLHGTTYRFGQLHDHHNYLYHVNHCQSLFTSTQTFQLLIYQLSEQSCDLFYSRQLTANQVRRHLCLDQILSGFAIDEHLFQPSGYSLNALKQDCYLTVHVTPNIEASYVSIEANFNLFPHVMNIIATVKPAAFDLLALNIEQFDVKLKRLNTSAFVCKAMVRAQLAQDSLMCFASFVTPQTKFIEAVQLVPHENSAGF